ncbi:MAG: DUF916 and DUF3324 domain-containing protein [Brochothrix thermosphacta]|uniref:DUF916 and DUF3324 domain-containing protein n=1 Tax=Brochothrix thermosphacta TaxID=2756 RepID=UPI003F926A60
MSLRKNILVMTTLVMMVLQLILILPVSASEFNFAVVPQKPGNQIDLKKGYFDLKMTPGQEQQLSVALTNSTNKAISIHPKIAMTTTNDSGVVDYSPSKKKADETLKYNIEDIVTTEKKVIIEADSTYVLKLMVKMPKESFKGSITGGLSLQEDEPEKKVDTQTSGMAIDNRYAYVVGLSLREDLKPVKPELKLNKVGPAQRNFRNVITANLQNTEATYVNQLKVDAKIMRKNDTEVLYESKKDMMQMAPNTNFNYPIALGTGEKLKPGKYTLDISAASYKNKWHWKEDFTITDDEASALNAKDVTIEDNNIWLYIISGLVLLLIVLLIIWLIVVKKKKNRAEENEND